MFQKMIIWPFKMLFCARNILVSAPESPSFIPRTMTTDNMPMNETCAIDLKYQLIKFQACGAICFLNTKWMLKLSFGSSRGNSIIPNKIRWVLCLPKLMDLKNRAQEIKFILNGEGSVEFSLKEYWNRMGYRSEKVEIKINLIVDQFIEVQLYLRWIFE